MSINKLKLPDFLLLAAVLLMMFGFLFSRALLSIGMVLLFLIALHPKEFKNNFKNFIDNRFALFCFLFFFIFLASGLWSEDKIMWWKDTQIKLPFLVLPFAMLNSKLQSEIVKKRIIHLVLFMLGIGMLYSFYYLIKDPQPFLEGKHFYGPLKGDYLRFSMALVLGLNMVFYLFIKHRNKSSFRNKVWLVSWSLFTIIYLHMQASKLGLLTLYSLFFIFMIYFSIKHIKKRKNWLKMTGLFFLICIIVWGSSKLPTIQYQIHKTIEEKHAIETQNKDYGGNSLKPRLVSYQAALKIIKNNPILGVGSGDWKPEMQNVYNKNFPGKHLLIPHNQFLFTMMAVGIPLSLFLILMVLTPLFRKPDIIEIATFAIMIFGLMVEAMLQIQYGVFVYLFFTLFWMSNDSKSNRLINTL